MKTVIKSAPGKGRGIFATKNLRKGELIEVAPYIVIKSTEYRSLKKTVLVNYLYSLGQDQCALGLGMASLYNHSEDSNLDYTFDRKTQSIRYHTVRSIKKGEELTIDYGYDPSATASWDRDLKSYFAREKRTRG